MKDKNKDLPVYEVVFDKEKSGVISINLTDKPLFDNFIKTT